MSKYSRMACTDMQEEAILALEQVVEFCGGITIGKSPQTVVVLDLTYQGSEIYVDADGDVKIDRIDINDVNDSDEIKQAIFLINARHLKWLMDVGLGSVG